MGSQGNRKSATELWRKTLKPAVATRPSQGFLNFVDSLGDRESADRVRLDLFVSEMRKLYQGKGDGHRRMSNP